MLSTQLYLDIKTSDYFKSLVFCCILRYKYEKQWLVNTVLLENREKYDYRKYKYHKVRLLKNAKTQKLYISIKIIIIISPC